MNHPHSSSLSLQQVRVLQAVRKHTQLTSSQVRRLLYTGTPEGTRIRSQRHLKRLYELGLIRRVWSVYDDRPAEYLYMPAGSTTRGAVMHTLDISELFVQLVERQRLLGPGGFVFEREPWSHIEIGRVTLKPDAYLEFGHDRRAFVEVDRGPERRPQLREKLTRYVNVFRHEWDVDRDGPHFPQVLWTVQDPDRRRVLRELFARTAAPEIFQVVLFEEAAAQILKKEAPEGF